MLYDTLSPILTGMDITLVKNFWNILIYTNWYNSKRKVTKQ